MASKAGLYIHVPFCASKCPYCDFYSTRDQSLVPVWLEALEREIRLYRHFSSHFDTIYFGGGTPTLLPERHLAQVMESLRGHFSFAPEAEVTIEANPDDLHSSRLKSLRELGFNRISLGIQSFLDHELVFLKRRHSAGEAARALERVQEAGFTNLSLDLIYGIPGQDLESWTATLKKALSFKPEHLSCYQFTIEPGTLFGVLKGKGALGECPESEGEMFFLTSSQYLAEQGYLHYEISNFARKEDNRCRHNLKYWQRLPYLGLGPSAHSFNGYERWWNFRSIKNYSQTLKKGHPPVEGREWLNDDQIRTEKLFLGFRTSEGVGLEEIEGLPRYRGTLDEFQRLGLTTMAHGRVVPTLQGFLVADRLPQRLC
jgi:putative oxygen-independent coproporphyrinogen III oxidase